MALVRSPVYVITITIRDRDLNTSTMQFYADTTNTMLELITDVEGTYIPRVQALTNGVVTGWTITTKAEDDGNTLAPEASDVQRKGVFSFSAANGSNYIVSVPSIRNELVIDRTNVLDTNNAAVADFVNMVISEAVLALTRPHTYLNSDIRRLEKAEKHHRASSRG